MVVGVVALPPGTGGAGGGGNGNVAGTTNTGGGGGSNQNGGSGVVIFTLPVQATPTFSGGVTQTSAVVGINRVYTVTAAGPTDTVTIG